MCRVESTNLGPLVAVRVLAAKPEKRPDDARRRFFGDIEAAPRQGHARQQEQILAALGGQS